MNAEMRAASVPLFSVDTHHDAGDFDVLAFGLAAELVYTNVLECLDLAGVPVRADQRRPEHPLVVVGGHCAFNPEPMADFVDAFVIGDGEEAVGEITEVVGRVEALRAHRAARACCASWPRSPASTCPSMYEVDVRRTVHRRGARRASPRCPSASTSAPSPTWRSGRTRRTSSCRSSRWCTTASTSRSSAAARAGAASARPG